MAALAVEIGQIQSSDIDVLNTGVSPAPGPACGTVATIERGDLDGGLRTSGRLVSDDDLGAAVVIEVADREGGPLVPKWMSPERLAVAQRYGAARWT